MAWCPLSPEWSRGQAGRATTRSLLLTNDGRLAHRLAHPRYEVDKVYEAEVEDPGPDALRRLAEGVELTTAGPLRRVPVDSGRAGSS